MLILICNRKNRHTNRMNIRNNTRGSNFKKFKNKMIVPQNQIIIKSYQNNQVEVVYYQVGLLILVLILCILLVHMLVQN